MDDFLSAFIQNLLMAFAPILASLAAAWLFTLVRKTWAEFRAAQPDAAYWLDIAARLAVRAAEQAGGAELIENKKAYALAVAEKWLEAKGLKLDLDLLDAAIEAAVWDEINKNRPLEVEYIDENGDPL